MEEPSVGDVTERAAVLMTKARACKKSIVRVCNECVSVALWYRSVVDVVRTS